MEFKGRGGQNYSAPVLPANSVLGRRGKRGIRSRLASDQKLEGHGGAAQEEPEAEPAVVLPVGCIGSQRGCKEEHGAASSQVFGSRSDVADGIIPAGGTAFPENPEDDRQAPKDQGDLTVLGVVPRIDEVSAEYSRDGQDDCGGVE